MTQKKFKKFGKLPGRPSELICLALDDLEKAEKSDRYKIDMRKWHHPAGGKCAVCLAGSVMAFSLKKSATKGPTPGLPSKEKNALFALNSFRAGEIDCAFLWLDIEAPSHAVPSEIGITSYKESPEKFKSDMMHLAYSLWELGY